MAKHIGQFFMRSVTTSYTMKALSAQGDFVLLSRVCFFGLGGTALSEVVEGWRFVEHFIVRIYMLEDPEIPSRPVSGRVGIQERVVWIQEGDKEPQ